MWSGLLGNPLGASGRTWHSALNALRGLMVAPLLVASRRYWHGYLILAQRTGWVVVGTVARTFTSVLFATLLSVVFDAGTFGIGLALTAGVTTEAAIVAFGCGRTRRSPRTNWRHVLAIAREHLPLSGSTLLAVAPASAVLVALAVSDGTQQTFFAWLVVFIGPFVIASVTLDIEAFIAADEKELAAGVLGFAALTVVSTVLWGLLAVEADLPGMPWLLPFPLLCVTREWLRGKLATEGRTLRTLLAVAAGSTTLLAAFVVSYEAGLQPISAAALAVSVGAFFEMITLSLSSRR